MVRGKSQISPPANYETYFSCSLSVGLFLLLFLSCHTEIWHLNIYLRQLVTFYSLYQATCNGFGLGVWGFSVYGALPLKFQSLGENFCRLEHFHIHKLWHNFDSFPCPCRVMLECLDLFPHFSLAGRCSSWLEFPGGCLGFGKWGKVGETVVGSFIYQCFRWIIVLGRLQIRLDRLLSVVVPFSWLFSVFPTHCRSFLPPPFSCLSVVIGLGGRYKCCCKCIFKCNKIITQLV